MDNRKKGPIVLLSILLVAFVYLGIAYLKGIYPFAGSPEGPTDLTIEERFETFVNSLDDASPEIKSSLIEQGIGVPDAQVVSACLKYEVPCSKDTASVSAELRYSIYGVSPDLIYLEARDLMFKGKQNEVYSYEEEQKQESKYNICHVDIKDVLGYCTTAWSKDKNGDYFISEDGYYLTRATLNSEYGYSRIIPYIICVLYDEADDSFELQYVLAEDATEWNDITVIHFYLSENRTGNGGSTSGNEGSNDNPSESHKCSNSSGCDEVTYLCYWCKKYHCVYHLCAKRRAYNYWASTIENDYELSWYAGEKEYYDTHPSAAADLEKWTPEFEEFGIRYNYD